MKRGKIRLVTNSGLVEELEDQGRLEDQRILRDLLTKSELIRTYEIHYKEKLVERGRLYNYPFFVVENRP